MVVTTEKKFDYTPEQVFDAIKSVDTLNVEKPFLLKMNLPIPTKCILEKEEVGALRTCYFKDDGQTCTDTSGKKIVEKVTEIQRPKILRMDVIDYKLMGYKWLQFKEAIYHFEKIGENACLLKRTTTYTSTFFPRFYWQFMEKIAIEQEHDYVLLNLQQDLEQHF